jgi:hypothetical protein
MGRQILTVIQQRFRQRLPRRQVMPTAEIKGTELVEIRHSHLQTMQTKGALSAKYLK